MKLRVGEVELFVAQRGRGRPLLLVHGFPLDHTMWQPQLEHLSDRYRVVAPDLRGFGRSQVVAGTATMPQLADDLALLLDALEIDEPVTLCGLSMGGYIAWQFWLRHADRLDRLVLCDTRAMADPPDVAQGRVESARRVLEEGTSEFVEGLLGKLFAEATLRDQPAVVAATQEVMRAASPVGVAAALRGMAERPDMTGRLGEIRIPTLVVCGQHDVISPPAEMQQIAAALPRATMLEVPDAGHMAPLEQPQQVNQAIRQFLSA